MRRSRSATPAGSSARSGEALKRGSTICPYPLTRVRKRIGKLSITAQCATLTPGRCWKRPCPSSSRSTSHVRRQGSAVRPGAGRPTATVRTIARAPRTKTVTPTTVASTARTRATIWRADTGSRYPVGSRSAAETTPPIPRRLLISARTAHPPPTGRTGRAAAPRAPPRGEPRRARRPAADRTPRLPPAGPGACRRRRLGPGAHGCGDPRGGSGRAGLLGPEPRDRPRLPPRQPRVAHGAARRRDRRRRAGVLLGVLLPPGGRAGPLRRGARRLRRLDARRGHHRRPRAALRLLGAHDRHLLPAHRALRRPQGVPARGHAGHRRDHRRRAGDARRGARARARRRHLPDLRDPRGAALRHGRRGRRRADPRRRGDQVRARAVPLLAALGDGRADAGLGLPARGGDGEGRRLPGGAPRARLQRPDRVAGGGARPRLGHPDGRRLPVPAAVRPQARPGVRHREPARAAHRPGGLRVPSGRARRDRHARGARHVQGDALPRRRRGRRGDRHPRPASAVRHRPAPARSPRPPRAWRPPR